jgi:adenylate cyclase
VRLGAPGRIAIGAAALGVLWTAVFAVPHLSGRRSIIDPLEAVLVDLRTAIAGVTPVDAPVTVVAIDDRTLAAPAFGFPIRREPLARLVAATAAAGAEAIALDVLLVDAAPAAENSALREALARAPAVVAAAAAFAGEASIAGVPEAAQVFWPAEFAGAAAVGFVNIVTDVAGTPQHIPALFVTADGVQPHFVLVAASLFLGSPPEVGADAVKVGDRSLPLDIAFHLPVRLAGPAGTVPTVSALDVLEGRVDLGGRIAVIGAAASAVGDLFPTPFGKAVPGVEVLAAGIAQFTGGPTLSRTARTRRIDAAAAAGLAVAGGAAVALLPLGPALIVAAALIAGWLGAVLAAFEAGIWLAAALPITAALPVMGAALVARQIADRRAARQTAQTAASLARLQSPALAAMVAADPFFLAEPRAVRLAVLFVDLAGFTGASERIGLEGTGALLRAFHSAVARTVEAHGGIVLNYIGDGALAAFGLPDGTDRDADCALAAAFALVPAMRALGIDGAPADGRIGVHCGRVLLSRLGGERHEQVTVAGDVVNVAARLMEVAKAVRATIAVSAAVAELAKRLPDGGEHITVPIRGRAEPLGVVLWRL